MKWYAALLLIAAMSMGVAVNAADKKDAPKTDAVKTKVEEPNKPAPAEPNKPAAKPVDPNALIVTVNGKSIKEKDIAPEIEKRINAQMQQMAGMGRPIDNEMKTMMANQMRDQVVDMMIDKQLLTEQIAAQKIDVNDAAVDARLETMIKDSGQKREEIEAMLAKQGVSFKEIKEQIEMQLSMEKLYEADSSYKAVTEADVNKFYTDNPQYFQQPEQVQASHILVKVDEKADEATKKAAKEKIDGILKKIKDGGNFAALAKENSDCPSKERDGDLGMFGRGQMVPQFETTAFAMKVGAISDVVETQFGYHIIKLTDKKEAKTTSLDEARPKITDFLKGQASNQFSTTFRQGLKTKAKIEWSAEEKTRREQREKQRQEQMAAQQMQMQQQQQAVPVPPQPEPEETK